MDNSRKQKIVALLVALMSSGGVAANTSVSANDLQSAEMIAELVRSGHLVVDTQTGNVKIQTSISAILEDAGVIKKVSPEEQSASVGSCNSTVACHGG